MSASTEIISMAALLSTHKMSCSAFIGVSAWYLFGFSSVRSVIGVDNCGMTDWTRRHINRTPSRGSAGISKMCEPGELTFEQQEELNRIKVDVLLHNS